MDLIPVVRGENFLPQSANGGPRYARSKVDLEARLVAAGGQSPDARGPL